MRDAEKPDSRRPVKNLMQNLRGGEERRRRLNDAEPASMLLLRPRGLHSEQLRTRVDAVAEATRVRMAEENPDQRQSCLDADTEARRARQ